MRSVIVPFPRAGADSQRLYLQVATTLAPVQARLETFIWPLAALAMLLTGVSWLVTWLTATRALNAARSLTAEAESIGIHELNRRVTLPIDLAEFNRMAAAFNALLDRLERAVTGTRRFTADASHELRAPLTVLRGELELALSRSRSSDGLRPCLNTHSSISSSLLPLSVSASSAA